jgi:hypothetical protein
MDHTRLREKATCFRVRDFVIGGGLEFEPGDIVELEDMGHYAEALVHAGALEPQLGQDKHSRSAPPSP